MDRQVALFLSIAFLILFILLAYYGAKVTLWSSLIFGLFVGLILLFLFYPPSQATSDVADISLLIYAIYVILGVILLGIYIAQRALSDAREENN